MTSHLYPVIVMLIMNAMLIMLEILRLIIPIFLPYSLICDLSHSKKLEVKLLHNKYNGVYPLKIVNYYVVQLKFV